MILSALTLLFFNSARADLVPRATFQTRTLSISRNYDEKEKSLKLVEETAVLMTTRLLPEFKEFFLPSAEVLDEDMTLEFPQSLGSFCGRVSHGSTRLVQLAQDCLSQTNFAPLIFHELQHLVENRRGPKEVWLNEGLSEVLSARLTGEHPTKKWMEFLNRGSTPPLRTDDGSSSSLFLTYLYQHFGEDHWLRQIILGSQKGLDAISKSVEGSDVDTKFLSTDALFANYMVALNRNSNYGSVDGLFSLEGFNPDLGLEGLKLQPSFVLLEPGRPVTISQSYYQIHSLRFSSKADCVVWKSTSERTKVVALKANGFPPARYIDPQNCFKLEDDEWISLTSFNHEATVEFMINPGR